jgi:hypothetical protein
MPICKKHSWRCIYRSKDKDVDWCYNCGYLREVTMTASDNKLRNYIKPRNKEIA